VRLTAVSEAPADTAQTGGTGIGHFFRSMFGLEEHREHRDIYAEAVRRGSCVLTVDTDSEQERDRATDIMNRYDPIDVEERAAHWRAQGWTGYDEKAPIYTEAEIAKEREQHATRTEEARMPVVEEELKVGKRTVQSGGVRIHQRVTETPVHETIELQQEHVTVERHPVDHPATEADMAAFKEGTVEVRESAEEAVVSKTARVVEEVVVDKEVSTETASVDDTVRKTDIEVEQIGSASTDADYRTHWQTAYGQSGGRYEDYDAAYRYGSMMAGSGRFKSYRWEDVEPAMRSDWEAQHPESTWDKVKDAVRYGAEKVTGRQSH